MRFVVLSLSVLPVAIATAQEPTFAPPVRLKAGEQFLGNQRVEDKGDRLLKGDRLFPSPVLHDVDGDGLADLVIGDLQGHLTVARRLPGATLAFAPETSVKGADGKVFDLGNW